MICILICSAICMSGASAAPETGDKDAVVRELAGIRVSLDRLAVLLQESRSGERALLLLRRIERREVRLATLEARLNSARSSRQNDEEQLAQIEVYRAQVDEEIRAARERGDQGIEGQFDNMIRQTEMEEERLKARIESIDAMILALEDQVAEGREAIGDLDLRLDEILALMDESN